MSVILQETKTAQEQGHDNKKELIKRIYCKGCSDDEVEIFVHVCRKTGLDPIMKQIYPIKRKQKIENRYVDVMTIITGIDGLRLIAERTGNYSPGRESTFTYDDKGILLSATSYIKKRTGDGLWHEVSATAYLEEYNAGQGLWHKMPRAMLSKCAESLALRKSFPAEMSGLYSKEEMDQAESPMAKLPETLAIEDSPELPDIPLTESQRMDIIGLLKKVKRREAHEAKIAENLEITDLYDILQSDFQRVVDYLSQVISIQDKEKIA
jgi:phage recombination protein Bet